MSDDVVCSTERGGGLQQKHERNPKKESALK